MDEAEKHEALGEERRAGYQRIAVEMQELVEALEGAGFSRDESIQLATGYIATRFATAPTAHMLETLLERLPPPSDGQTD